MPIADAEWQLEDEEREELIDQMAITFAHQKAVGSSFEIGRTFYEQVLEAEPTEPEPVFQPAFTMDHETVKSPQSRSSAWISPRSRAPASMQPFTSVASPPLSATLSSPLSSPSKALPPAPSESGAQATVPSHTPDEHGSPPMPLTRAPFLTGAASADTESFPRTKVSTPGVLDDSNIEDRHGWVHTRDTIDQQGRVNIQAGKPSRTMQRLEEELQQQREKMTAMVAGQIAPERVWHQRDSASHTDSSSMVSAFASIPSEDRSDRDSFVSAPEEVRQPWRPSSPSASSTSSVPPITPTVSTTSSGEDTAPFPRTPQAPTTLVQPTPKYATGSLNFTFGERESPVRSIGPSPSQDLPPSRPTRPMSTGSLLPHGEGHHHHGTPSWLLAPIPGAATHEERSLSTPRRSPGLHFSALKLERWHPHGVGVKPFHLRRHSHGASIHDAPTPSRRSSDRPSTPESLSSLLPEPTDVRVGVVHQRKTSISESLLSKMSSSHAPARPKPEVDEVISLHRNREMYLDKEEGWRMPSDNDAVAPKASAPPILSRYFDFLLPKEKEVKQLQDHATKILKRDRMLVKVRVSSHMDISAHLDALEARRYEMRSYKWEEYIVVLRPGRVEFWSVASIRGHVLGDMEYYKLRYSVALKPGEVSLSLYSEVDRLFCLSFPRAEGGSRRGGLPFRRHGTTVLIMAARAFSVASDWMWLLWRELGGGLPRHLHVHIPSISLRVRVPMPPASVLQSKPREYDAQIASCDTFDTDYMRMMASWVINETSRLAVRDPQWASLKQDMDGSGKIPALIWRSGTTFNRVQYDVSTTGEPRYWNLLVGLLVTSRRHAPVLEMLVRNHYPTEALHPRGFVLREPEAVEGFVLRLRVMSGIMTRVYLSVHDGCLFLLRDSHAFVPDRYSGVPLPEVDGLTREKRITQRVSKFLDYERERQWQQLKHSDGFIDLREVCAIGNVGANVVLCTELSRHSVHLGHVPDPHLLMQDLKWLDDYDGTRASVEKYLPPPVDDIGGSEGLHSAPDRQTAKLLRQFELYLDNGRRVTFECASASLARDWIVHLFMLSVYWRSRHRSYVRRLMEAGGNGLQHGRNEDHIEDLASNSLSYVWNWCALDRCRAISIQGELFWRTNARQPFHKRVFVVSDGQLLSFKLMQSIRTSTRRRNEGIVYRRKGAPISLCDAYVYTGSLADRSTDLHGDDGVPTRFGTREQQDVHEALPRLYRDGLTSAQSNEDCTFVLRARSRFTSGKWWHPFSSSHGETPTCKRTDFLEITFRARTTLERDVWVRVLSAEIEKVVRAHPQREDCLRHFGRIPS